MTNWHFVLAHGLWMSAYLALWISLTVKMIEVSATGLASMVNIVIPICGNKTVALKIHALARDAPAATGNHAEYAILDAIISYSSTGIGSEISAADSSSSQSRTLSFGKMSPKGSYLSNRVFC